MKDVYPQTSNEEKMIKAIQRVIGAYDNGVIGNQTLSDIAIKLEADCFPLTLSIYGQPTIIAKDIIPFKSSSGTSRFKNSMVGSFTYPSGVNPCSILISSGVVFCGTSCHAHIDKPETVIYRTKYGTIGAKKVKSTSELPNNINWAVGGMGLCDMYNPEEEGFTGLYSDVLRKTNHAVLGVKNNMIFGVYYKNMTGQQIQSHVSDKMQFEHAILLDGGHLASINGTETFAQINTQTKQGYMIQFL